MVNVHVFTSVMSLQEQDQLYFIIYRNVLLTNSASKETKGCEFFSESFVSGPSSFSNRSVFVFAPVQNKTVDNLFNSLFLFTVWLFKRVRRRESVIRLLTVAVNGSDGLLSTFVLFRIRKYINRIRFVLACCGGNVIVQNSEFCDRENTGQYVSRPKPTRKFWLFRCCVRSNKRERKE